MAGRGYRGQGGRWTADPPQPGFGPAANSTVARWNAERTRAFQRIAAMPRSPRDPSPRDPSPRDPSPPRWLGQPTPRESLEWLCVFPADHPIRGILAPPFLGLYMEWAGWFEYPYPLRLLSEAEQNSVIQICIEPVRAAPIRRCRAGRPSVHERVPDHEDVD